MDKDVCDPRLAGVRCSSSHVLNHWVEVVHVLKVCAINSGTSVGLVVGIEICELAVVILVTPIRLRVELAVSSQRSELLSAVTNVLEGLSVGHSIVIISIAQL